MMQTTSIRHTVLLIGLTGIVSRLVMLVRAPLVGGSVTTKPLKFTGERLVINYSTSGAGSVRVEIQDESGAPVPGFSLAESVRQVGDALEQTVRWESDSDVGRLSGRTIRLRFVLHDADLYAFRFARN